MPVVCNTIEIREGTDQVVQVIGMVDMSAAPLRSIASPDTPF